MNTQFKPGTKVEINTGVLKGERATVEINPETGSHCYDDEVWIRFEKDGEYLPDKGHAILTPQWEEVRFLRAI